VKQFLTLLVRNAENSKQLMHFIESALKQQPTLVITQQFQLLEIIESIPPNVAVVKVRTCSMYIC
jgi:hypothetical protein